MSDPLGPQALLADARRLAEIALAEDGYRDVTSLASVTATQHGTGVLEARAALVLSGTAYADAVVAACELPAIEWQARDGDAVPAGAVTSTSQLAARPRAGEGGASGSTTVSRICIGVSGPFCAGADQGPSDGSPHPTRAHRPVLHASSHLPLTTRPPTEGK